MRDHRSLAFLSIILSENRATLPRGALQSVNWTTIYVGDATAFLP